MSGRIYDKDPVESSISIDNYQGYPEGPQGGIYVPVPAAGQPPLVIDIRRQGPSGWSKVFIEIFCEVTTENIEQPAMDDGVFWVFTKDSDTALVGLPGDFQFDQVRALPAALSVGESVQEQTPTTNPFLQLVSRNNKQAEVRVRVV